MASSIQIPYLSQLRGKPEFLNKDKTIIVFNEEVTGSDVVQSAKSCIRTKFWPKRTRILIICGFHTNADGKMGASFSAIHGTISASLGRLKEELSNEIEEMEYTFESVLLSTVPYKDKDGKIQYELDSLGESNLRSKFLSVLDSKDPHALIFGTCFSKKSEINHYISACGLYPALFLCADLGNVTEGRRFQLDDQQIDVIKQLSEVLELNSRLIIE